MLQRVLDEAKRELVGEVRSALTGAVEVLAASDADEGDRRTLSESVHQLDRLFLLVVVGEFNAGKSAVINALLGRPLLEEGVTPTTSKIQVIGYGDAREVSAGSVGLDRLSVQAELLRDVDIVDTPGTNALSREHEALTNEFVPRSDLVLFVTSADRPFSESERAFLERIRGWGKKVVILINKKDILSDPAAVAEVEAYVIDQGRRLLDLEPEVFTVSAKEALRAVDRDDAAALRDSGLPAVERYLRRTLDEAERLRLKLLNPIGVAKSLLEQRLRVVDEQTGLLADDVRALEDIETQLATFREDVGRQFQLRLGDIDTELHRIELRGLEFFDETVRLGRLPDLLRKERIRREFEEKVVGDIPGRIEQKVDALIDWLVESNVRQWQGVVEHVSERRSRHAGRIVGTVGGRFELDRRGLLDTVGRAARAGMESYDRVREAERLANGVQQAVAGTAIVEAGAVGLGAAVALVASSTAVDVTGIVAAGVLGAIGLFIIPARRSRAKRELHDRIEAMRAELMDAVSEQFESEADAAVTRIRDTIAPYSRFVRSERGSLDDRRRRIDGVLGRLARAAESVREVR